jgi:hypothetical protein
MQDPLWLEVLQPLLVHQQMLHQALPHQLVRAALLRQLN